jgi:trans-aconitate methyltransferase
MALGKNKTGTKTDVQEFDSIEEAMRAAIKRREPSITFRQSDASNFKQGSASEPPTSVFGSAGAAIKWAFAHGEPSVTFDLKTGKAKK